MLSEEKIKELWDALDDQDDLNREDCFKTAVHRIEAAVLPEGWVAVPKEPTEEMLEAALRANLQHVIDCINDPAKAKEMGSEEQCKLTYASRYRSMLAAAPKPAQAEKQEPVKDEPVAWMVVTSYDKLIFQNASQAEHCAEKWELVSAPLYTRPQPEPVNDEPVARVDANDDGYWAEILPDRSVKVGQLLYTRPQPDLTAEVERLKLSAEHWNRLYREKCQEFHDAQANKGQEIVWLIDRIATLEEAAREARGAFEQHDGNYKLSKASGAVVEKAIAKLDGVLGNAD